VNSAFTLLETLARALLLLRHDRIEVFHVLLRLRKVRLGDLGGLDGQKKKKELYFSSFNLEELCKRRHLQL
jgi:hypothetical protein